MIKVNLNSLIDLTSFIPDSIQPPDSWCGHLPFAAWLVQTFKPRTIVELGTYSGNSYLSFCQAVSQNRLDTKCYAVDTWQGDAHAGEYTEEVYNRLHNYHQDRYAGFSRLLRMTFDEAVGHFADNSIDLLHIDGLHTYEAVRHDFEAWLPKLAPGAVVLFHDTNVREQGFAVWKLWAELQARYPNNLEFIHSHGLGVLQLDNGPSERLLEWLTPGSHDRQLLLRHFSFLGERQMERYALVELKNNLTKLNQAISVRDQKIEELKWAVSEKEWELASIKCKLRLLYIPWHLGKLLIAGLVRPLQAYRLHQDVRTIKNSNLFNVGYYISNYRDVRMNDKDPVRHYCEYGWKENRNPSPLFNTNDYLTDNPEVAKAGVNPFVHYILHGKQEERHTRAKEDDGTIYSNSEAGNE